MIILYLCVRQEDIPDDYPVFMCTAESCGHDRRGKELENNDDISLISAEFKKWKKENSIQW